MMVSVRNDKVRRVTLFANSPADSNRANRLLDEKAFEPLLNWLCHCSFFRKSGTDRSNKRLGFFTHPLRLVGRRRLGAVVGQKPHFLRLVERAAMG